MKVYKVTQNTITIQSLYQWDSEESRMTNLLCIYRISYMSAHVLLNLINELGKSDKCEACRAFYLFFTTSVINSIIQEQEC